MEKQRVLPLLESKTDELFAIQTNSVDRDSHNVTYVERDESGSIIAHYTHDTSSNTLVEAKVRTTQESYLQTLFDVFLPAGYPQSVTEDYLPYQVYDSLQAFSSSIAGLLSSRALLQGIGVGDSSASASNAVLVNILQDSVGRFATILFAHRLGTSLEPECKRYRFLADVMNDSAMILDCLSPALPKTLRIIALCTSGTLRALCGVAAGASKASLSVHFAKWGTVAELNAKDSSQETVIGLMGMLAGSLVVSRITSLWSTWTTMIFLIGVHLYTNYRAVRSVTMHTLNRQRVNIVASDYFSNAECDRSIMDIKRVAMVEHIFERDGILRWGRANLGTALIGVSLPTFQKFISSSTSNGVVSKNDLADVPTSEILKVFDKEKYCLWFSMRQRTGMILLKSGSTGIDQIKAWIHMLLLAHKLSRSHPVDLEKLRYTIFTTKTQLDLVYPTFLQEMREKGWRVELSTLETTPGRRMEETRNLVEPKKDV